MSAAKPHRGKVRFLWLAALGAVLVLLVLAFDLRPVLPPKGPPDAAQVVAGRAAFRQVKTAVSAPPPSTTVTLTNRDLADIATLAGNALHIRRVDASVQANVLHLAGSLEPIPGVWMNLAADVRESRGGFPVVDAQVGAVPLPNWLTRFGLDAAHRLLVWRGSELPPLDDLVRGLQIDGDVLKVELKSPLGKSGLVRQATGVMAHSVDDRRVLELFCALSAEQVRAPDPDLAVHLRRAFAEEANRGRNSIIADNRAALVAVAMLAVGRPVGDLAGDIQAEAEACPGATGNLLLAGRNDLAKHWSLSAALAAVAGDNVGRALGEFKELADSTEGGSGFSFVDLAADRAGLRVGQAATTSSTARAARAVLAQATNADLLPLDARQLSEGLSSDAFVARYRDIESPQYAAAVRRIDAMLDAAGLFPS
jgi:uncharacterized protein YfiM (DUF2279 family)